MAGKTERLQPPDPDFAKWKSTTGEVFTLRTRHNGKPDPLLLAKALLSSMSEMIRGGDPEVVLSCFGIQLDDADGQRIWPVTHKATEPDKPPAPKSPRKKKTSKKLSEAS